MAARIFIALSLTSTIHKRVAVFQEKYCSLPVRWIKAEDLHITLVPPWDEQHVEAVRGKFLACPLPFKNFAPLRFSKVTFGPNPKNPRLIWAEGETLPGLPALKIFLEKYFGFPPEPRSFKLHLTLARFRPEDFRDFPVQKLSEKIDWDVQVQAVVLFESKLERQGAKYFRLAEIPLL